MLTQNAHIISILIVSLRHPLLLHSVEEMLHSFSFLALIHLNFSKPLSPLISLDQLLFPYYHHFFCLLDQLIPFRDQLFDPLRYNILLCRLLPIILPITLFLHHLLDHIPILDNKPIDFCGSLLLILHTPVHPKQMCLHLRHIVLPQTPRALAYASTERAKPLGFLLGF